MCQHTQGFNEGFQHVSPSLKTLKYKEVLSKYCITNLWQIIFLHHPTNRKKTKSPRPLSPTHEKKQKNTFRCPWSCRVNPYQIPLNNNPALPSLPPNPCSQFSPLKIILITISIIITYHKCKLNGFLLLFPMMICLKKVLVWFHWHQNEQQGVE